MSATDQIRADAKAAREGGSSVVVLAVDHAEALCDLADATRRMREWDGSHPMVAWQDVTDALARLDGEGGP